MESRNPGLELSERRILWKMKLYYSVKQRKSKEASCEAKINDHPYETFAIPPCKIGKTFKQKSICNFQIWMQCNQCCQERSALHISDDRQPNVSIQKHRVSPEQKQNGTTNVKNHSKVMFFHRKAFRISNEERRSLFDRHFEKCSKNAGFRHQPLWRSTRHPAKSLQISNRNSEILNGYQII